MKSIHQKKVLVTGATGGIGSQLSMLLAKQGARLALSSRSRENLVALKKEIELLTGDGNGISLIEKNLLLENAGSELVKRAWRNLNGLDMVINLAGTQTFRSLVHLNSEDIHQQITMNLLAPIEICREAIVLFDRNVETAIVNIGSTFGSIGFSQHAVYCASKFGLRGFSESLRRELQDTRTEVLYIAPRATRTSLNSKQVYDMAEAAGTAIDPPSLVAADILKAIRASRPVTYMGQPEGMACRINSLFPVLFDKVLRKQSRLADDFANHNLSVKNEVIP